MKLHNLRGTGIVPTREIRKAAMLELLRVEDLKVSHKNKESELKIRHFSDVLHHQVSTTSH
jgi:hypothetical protein